MYTISHKWLDSWEHIPLKFESNTAIVSKEKKFENVYKVIVIFHFLNVLNKMSETSWKYIMWTNRSTWQELL